MDGARSSNAPLASRVWSQADQIAFARATGDVNPMHIDVQVARRTLAGGQAVHGVHAALWALDACADVCPLERLSALQMRFERFVLVGDHTALMVHEADAARMRLSLSVSGVRVATIQALFGGERQRARPVEAAAMAIPFEPVTVEPGTIAGAAGMFRLPEPEAVAALVPRLAHAIGAPRVAALGGLSTLVGMFVPGLHSILSKIDVTLTGAAEGSSLGYAVERFQPMLQSVTIQASGPGLDARVESFLRPRPVEQESGSELAALVRPGEFSGISALIVGGSRGLGATTAKLLAAGGGDVCITYASGASEGETVARDIRDGGGRCQVMHYDATLPIGVQLESLTLKPCQLYHFATPRIFRQKRAHFEPDRFAEMMQIYNHAFYDLCLFCLNRHDRLAAFYPSTTAIDEPPRDALEYIMAKTAGETLATGLARTIPNLKTFVERLPRTRTDQTATIFPVPAASPGAVMLPIIRQLSEPA